MRIAVCIVGFRNIADIVACLHALERSLHSDFEVVICENGGPAAYDALIEAIPSALSGGQAVRTIQASGNLGFAGGVNVCLKAAQADAWWVLNPDAEPEPEAMGAMATRLQAGDVDAVGCKIVLPNGRVQSYGGIWQRWIARAVSIGNGEPADARPDPVRIEGAQNYLNGASMMVSRRFLEVVGPMREDYFLYCEEVEWCLRALARKVRLGYAPDAVVLHHQGTTTGNVHDLYKRPWMPVYLGERNKLLLTRDCYGMALPVVLLGALATIFLKYGRRGAWNQVAYALDGLWAGLLNRRGAPARMKV